MIPAFLWHPNGYTRIPVREPISRVSRERAVKDAIAIVADRFGLTVPQIREKTNQRVQAFPRQVAAYLIHHCFPWMSLSMIGIALSGQHHTTVLHSIRKIERQVQTDSELATTVRAIRAELEGGV